MKTIKIWLGIMAACLTFLILSGCTTARVVQNPDGTTATIHEVDPRLTTGIETGKAVNAATAAVNPYAPLINLGFGAAAAIAALVARQKSSTAAKWEDVATTIIQGVEAAGTEAAAVKKSIEARSVSDGNKLLVDATVQKELT